MATHSSVLAWRIPGLAGPSGLPFMGVAQSWTRLKRLSSSSSHPGQRSTGCSPLEMGAFVSWSAFFLTPGAPCCCSCQLVGSCGSAGFLKPESREGKGNHKRLKGREPRTPAAPPCPLQSLAPHPASQSPWVHRVLRHHYSCH